MSTSETKSDSNIPLRNKKDSLELKLTLDREMLDSEVVFPVVGQALVERAVLLLRDVRRVARPDGLRLVEFLVRRLLLLDRLLFLPRRRPLTFVLDLLDLGLILVFSNL